MKSCVVAMILLGQSLMAGHVHAEWQSMGAGADGEVFVDAERLRKSPDGTVTFWQLEIPGTTPRKAPNGKVYASTTTRFILRCEAGTYILRNRLYHPKANGEGGIVYSENVPQNPRWVAPEGDSDMARWLPGMCYRANVLELFEKRDRESGERLNRMR